MLKNCEQRFSLKHGLSRKAVSEYSKTRAGKLFSLVLTALLRLPLLRASADNNGFATGFRALTLLNRSVKMIHIQVENNPRLLTHTNQTNKGLPENLDLSKTADLRYVGTKCRCFPYRLSVSSLPSYRGLLQANTQNSKTKQGNAMHKPNNKAAFHPTSAHANIAQTPPRGHRHLRRLVAAG